MRAIAERIAWIMETVKHDANHYPRYYSGRGYKNRLGRIVDNHADELGIYLNVELEGIAQ